MFYSYILKCYKNNSKTSYNYYKGHTNNIDRRLKEHQNGKAKSTKRYKGNIELVYYETFDTRSKAYRRELEFKSLTRTQIHDLISTL